MADDQTTAEINNVDLATSLTVAWLSNGHTRASADEVTSFIRTIHSTITGLTNGGTTDQASEAPATEYTPAVSARKALADPDYIISMIDGKKYKTLRRHIAGHGLTPETYRERYNLKPDFPMVAPNYAAARSEMARKIGLGRKPGESPKRKAAEAPASKARGRAKSISEAKAAAAQHLNGDADA